MLKKLLLLILAFTAGFLGYSAITGQLGNLYQTVVTTTQPIANFFTGITNFVQPTITQIQQTWTSIPDSLRGILIAGIPTLFMVFFAWSKNRAMQKLEETKLQATQQINQIEGEALDAKAQVQTLTEQVKVLEAPKAEIERLSTNLSEAQALLSEQKRDYELQLAKKQGAIEDLHRLLEAADKKVIEVTRVK